MKKLVLILLTVANLYGGRGSLYEKYGHETIYSMNRQLIFKNSKETGDIVVAYSPKTKVIFTICGVDEPQLSNFYQQTLWVLNNKGYCERYKNLSMVLYII